MNAPAPRDPVEDAKLACALLIIAPQLFGGMVLRGASPAREAVLEALRTAFAAEDRPVRRLPLHADDDALLGGVDLAASLAAGRAVQQSGLIEATQNGLLVAPMAERLEPRIAGRLVQALDKSAAESAPLLLALDDSQADDGPDHGGIAAALADRLAFHLDLTASRHRGPVPLDLPLIRDIAQVAPLDPPALRALAGSAQALGVAGLRPLFFAAEAARAHAALGGRDAADKDDLAIAARLVLAPRATQLPEMAQEDAPQDTFENESEDAAEADTPEAGSPPPEAPEDKDDSEGALDDMQSLEETLIDAAKTAIPDDLLASLAAGEAARRSPGGGSGRRVKSGMRGKPLGARPGMPRGGARLALIDTLRAAVPLQRARRLEAKGREAEQATDTGSPLIQIRKQDIRVRRFEDKAIRLTIFAVDASGSAAAARLAEAKGAIEMMLAQAYVTRSEVALVAFRGDNAELLMPPTRSLTRARRSLAELPGGGGTPLAMGLDAARECAESAKSRGRSPSLVILTDGRANIDANGAPGRQQARADAEASARAIARLGIDALIIDISSRPGPEGGQLAKAMQARFLALPRADAGTIHQAIDAVQKSNEAA